MRQQVSKVPQVAIICSAIPARFKSLIRSVITWQESIKRSGLNAAIYVWVDGDDGHGLSPILRYPNVHMVCNVTKSGSHILGYNYWYKAIQADAYIFTHPDMLFPWDTVKVAHEYARVDDVFVAFKCFWMSQNMTENIERYTWEKPETLEHVQALYDDDEFAKGTFYSNATVKNIKVWESSTTFAVNNRTAAKMFPLPDFAEQGPDDPFQAGLRTQLGIKNHTVMKPILMHQWHPNTWNGTSEDAVAKAQKVLIERLQK